MHSNKATFFLFPHMVVPEWMGRRFGLLLPELKVLDILGEERTVVGAWNRGQTWAALASEEERQEVRFLLGEYRRLADVHGPEDLLGVWVRDCESPDLSESRFAIQAHTRGGHQPSFSKQALMRIEAAVFLELARDLDEKELELNASLNQVQQLEDRFRKVLGLDDGEEAAEVLEAAEVQLSPDWGHFSYQLRERMGCWWRLVLAPAPSAPVVYSVLFEDVVEELIDPVKTERERNGSSWDPARVILGEIEDPADLGEDQWAVLKGILDEQGCLEHYPEVVADLLARPGDDAVLSRLETLRGELEGAVGRFFAANGNSKSSRIQWILSDFGDTEVAPLWRRYDRRGWEVLGKDSSLARQRIATMHWRKI